MGSIMDNAHIRFNLRAGIVIVVAALLTGPTVYAADAPKQSAAAAQKAGNKAKQPKAKKKAKLVRPAAAAQNPKPKEISPDPSKSTASPRARPAESIEAREQSPELRELTHPKSAVEAGVLGVTGTHWKFGQYNGLYNSGAYGIGNFDIRGGGVYDSDDATRWRIAGKNIGLETREFVGEYKNQGRYKFNFGYDEIPTFAQGTYRTPYQGAGGNHLSLPDDWAYPANSFNVRTLPSSDYNNFSNVDLITKRRRIDGGFSYSLSQEWELKASMRHENKNGINALGASLVSDWGAVILPNPISQTTDQVNASLNFTGTKGYAQFAYYSSLFHNDFNSVSFDNAYAAPSISQPAVGRMSTMPSNQFHQFNLSGGYNFSADTKLVGAGSYGRNWQDSSFLPYNATTLSSAAFLPRSNLGGDVEFKSANLKLTHRQSKDLNFIASYKYDERDNHTPVTQYVFPDTDSVGPFNFRSNTPYSKRNQQGNLDLNYSFAQGHWLKLGYELQNIDRWCNGTWTSCVDTGTTTENTGKIDYRGNFWDTLNAKMGYAYSYRAANHYNQDAAWAASFASPQAMAFYNQLGALGVPAWGPYLGYPKGSVPYPYPALFPDNNPGNTAVPNPLTTNPIDIAGLGRFNTSARERQAFHAMLDYQATDKLSFGVNGNYRYDNYPQSRYGLQSSKNWAINFDTNYTLNEDTSAHVFYTYQNIASTTLGSSYGNNSDIGTAAPGSVIGGCFDNVLAVNNNAKIDPCRGWLSNMTDNIDSLGFGLKRKGLFSGKLEINGDFFYSFARTLVDVAGGQYIQSPTGTVADGPYYFIDAAPLPVVKSQTFTFKLDAKYAINKSSAAHLTYLYQHLISNDYIYTGMQPAGTPTNVLPTLEKAPVYSINVIGLSYIYNF
jgi:MtrB/PioB family decaheme-associated outer membrane protein